MTWSGNGYAAHLYPLSVCASVPVPVENPSSPFPIAAPTHRRPSRLLLCAAGFVAAVFIIVASPTALGARIECWLFPVFASQAIPPASIIRTNRSLCWTWERTKLRAPPAVDIDVTLDTADGDTYSPEIFNGMTGEPWHTGGALPPGQYASQFCTTIPAAITRSLSTRLRQVLIYRGFLGLWMIRVPLPAIIAVSEDA